MDTEDDDLDEETILSRFGRGRRLGRERAAMRTAMGAGSHDALPISPVSVGITPVAAGPGAVQQQVQQQAQQHQAHVQVREQKVRVGRTANPNPIPNPNPNSNPAP